VSLDVAHVGLGPLGLEIVRAAHERGAARVAIAIDSAPALVGRDLSELVAGLPPGVRVRPSPLAISDWTGVRLALVTTSSDLELCMDTFRELLTRGVSVVSTCEELAWPWLRHPVLAQELHELCVRHRVRIVGTGVNPGYLMDALPVALTHACHRVRHVRVERVQDAARRRLPFQRKVGVGLSPEEFEARASAGSLRHVGLGESLHLLAYHAGLTLERWEESLEPVLAERETPSGLGPVPAGHARGVLQVARGFTGGKAVIELVFRAGAGEPRSYDRVQVDGDPPLDVTFEGGVHGDVATAAIVLNTLRPLLAAEPGLHTMASLPLAGCGVRG